MAFRNNTTSADTRAVEPQLPTDPIYDHCASFNDCNACTYEYDDFVSISANISHFETCPPIQKCGFCYEEDQSANGQGQGSCVPWAWPATSKEPQAYFGRYSIILQRTCRPCIAGVIISAFKCSVGGSPNSEFLSSLGYCVLMAHLCCNQFN